MESKQFDLFYADLEKAFKTGTVYVCPDCKNATVVHSNPYYLHKCEHCGREGYYTQLTLKTVKETVEEIVNKHFKDAV